jgi:hypothetical protein
MRARRYPLILLLALTPALTFASASNVQPQTNVETVAREATHFATKAIVENRQLWGRGFLNGSQNGLRDLLTEQAVLADELVILSRNPQAMRQRLKDPDARIRTVALGALFIREDPQDLPSIAVLMTDQAQTIPDLHNSMNAMGPGPLSAMERPQTVGEVARAMVQFYLDAAHIRVVGKGSSWATPDDMHAAFESYWSDRSDRKYCASWFLVKLERATRRTEPTQPEYSRAINAVLAQIAVLPSPEQEWTIFFVVNGGSLPAAHYLVSDTALLQAAKTIGPDALMNFLQFKSFSTDPDLRFSDVPSDPRNEIFLPIAWFVLAHAPQLLRSKDASTLRGDTFTEWHRFHSQTGAWLAAADSLDAVENYSRGVAELKADIARFPIIENWSDEGQQITLALTLWRLSGAKEADFLTSWFYTLSRVENPSFSEGFLRSVEAEHRADTRDFLKAIVADKRFETTNWSVLVQLMKMAGGGRKTPLVDTRELYDHQPNARRPDQTAVLASWRSLLRRHYGLADVSEIVRQIGR